MSIYNDSLVTIHTIANSIKRLKIAFPEMTKEFWSLLTEEFIDAGFTEKRVEDAVKNVIRNFNYKKLNIADIISFNKKVKLYTYDEVTNLVTKGEYQFSDFEIREFNNNTFRVLKKDLV